MPVGKLPEAKSLLTDDDCYPDPNFLTSIFNVFEQQPSLGFLGGRILLHDPTDYKITILEKLEREDLKPKSFVPAGFIQGANFSFRRSALEAALKVINHGVAEHKGQLEFWVCYVSEWSSFRRNIASRNGAKHHATTVECLPNMDIVDEFGVADYMKIDIEGNDRICIGGLTCITAPKYISIVMEHSDGDQSLNRLFALGYRGFKVICQSDSWQQVTTRNMSYYDPLVHRPFVQRCMSKLRIASSNKRLGTRGLNGWRGF